MPSNDNNDQKQIYLNQLGCLPLETLIELCNLGPAPMDTIRKFAYLFEQAVHYGLIEAMQKGQAKQFKKSGGYGTTIYEAARSNEHTEVMRTTIDWYADGAIFIDKLSRGGIDIPIIDFKAIEGLYLHIWQACVEDAINHTFKERAKREAYYQQTWYENSPVKNAFEELCLSCANRRQGRSEFCCTDCQEAFWVWCKRRAKAGINARTKAFQRKLKENRQKIPPILPVF